MSRIWKENLDGVDVEFEEPTAEEYEEMERRNLAFFSLRLPRRPQASKNGEAGRRA